MHITITHTQQHGHKGDPLGARLVLVTYVTMRSLALRSETHMKDKPLQGRVFVKTTVLLRRDQVVRLDRLAIDIRASNGSILTRAGIIRACIEVVLGLDLDVSQVFDEQDLIDLIHQRISL